MAKRELSSTLKSLKFMQRASQKEELSKKEEPVIAETSGNRKCIVIMESDPSPGAAIGRMSFQDFNPSIQKLNSEAEDSSKQSTTKTPAVARNATDVSMNIASHDKNAYLDEKNPSDIDEIQRKRMKVENDTKASTSTQDRQHPYPMQRRNTRQEQRRFDWNLLQPPNGRRR